MSCTQDAELQASLGSKLSSDTAAMRVASGDADLVVNLGGHETSTSSFRRLGPIRSFGREALGWTESRVALEVALEDNEDVRSYDMLEDGDRLQMRLQALGLRLDRQRGDGNCQFRAVSQQVYGTPEKHAKVRKRACEYLTSRNGRRRFEPYLGDEFDEYIRVMRRDGTWGDELTLRAIAESYHVIVTVVTSTRENWVVRYLPDAVLKTNAEVFLAYLWPCHYDRIDRISST